MLQSSTNKKYFAMFYHQNVLKMSLLRYYVLFCNIRCSDADIGIAISTHGSNTYRTLGKTLNETDIFQNLGLHGRIKLKCIWSEQKMGMCTWLIWLFLLWTPGLHETWIVPWIGDRLLDSLKILWFIELVML
jgi:hypothetical protein